MTVHRQAPVRSRHHIAGFPEYPPRHQSAKNRAPLEDSTKTVHTITQDLSDGLSGSDTAYQVSKANIGGAGRLDRTPEDETLRF